MEREDSAGEIFDQVYSGCQRKHHRDLSPSISIEFRACAPIPMACVERNNAWDAAQ